ncbi:MAG: BlaI/MecI/CopY family transcriptional regulator [Bacteriovoracaceae bacterium]|jgi:predicted transcriptional regulator|nr:BlaI/MecI/CopY family transcriptional regulator [Bacteriovoracaceae bacterium]
MPKDQHMLTEVELELMNILWSIGSGSVKDIMEKMGENRNLAYTSVSTMVRILEKKNAVSSQKQGRGHIYTPQLEKSDYQKKSVNNLLDTVFEGAPQSIVKCLIDENKISKKELISLCALIEQGEL